MNTPGRRKKVSLKLSEESMVALMQETYNETVDMRNRAIKAYNQYTKEIEESTDIPVVGKVANDLLKIVDNSIEKKLRLLKIQGDIIFKNGKTGPAGGSGNIVISDEDKEFVQKYLAQQGANKSKDYSE